MLPIHALEDIKGLGESLALKERELLELRKNSKHYNTALETANLQLVAQRNDLKQKEHDLMQMQAENIYRENVDLQAVIDQSLAIDQQELQLKADISHLNQKIKEDEATYTEKCNFLAEHFGLLSLPKVENKHAAIRNQYQNVLDQKNNLQSQINFVQDALKLKRTLENDIEAAHLFGNFVQDEINNCNQTIDMLHEEVKSLTIKRDKMKNGDCNDDLGELENQAQKLRAKIEEHRNFSKVVNSSYIPGENDNSSRYELGLTKKNNNAKKFRFMP